MVWWYIKSRRIMDEMKSIYLIGDSIRIGSANSPGYGIYVKEKMDGKCNVFAPSENCRFAQYTLRALCDWTGQIDPNEIDVVHWNNGLWDVLRLQGDEPLTPIDVYVNMLERVYKKIKLLFPKAEIIFALSTPVIEKNAPQGWMRYNAEIELYNNAAKELMNNLGVEINDLYSVAMRFDESYYADWTHFNEKGAKILADAVVKVVDKEKNIS